MADHDAFVALVRTLRDLGAVRVRDGSLEVAFAAPPAGESAQAAAELPSDVQAAIAYVREQREELS